MLVVPNLLEILGKCWIEKQENALLGSPLTATAIDNKVTTAMDRCEDCNDSDQLWTIRTVPVILEQIILTETKRGKNPGQRMARIFVYDSTGRIDNLPVFPDQFLACEDLLIENNTVNVKIKKGRTGWIVEEMEQI